MAETTKINIRGFAMQYGTIVGAVWIACFAGFIGQFRHELLGTFVFWGSILSIILSGMFARSFRAKIIGNSLSGGRAFAVTWAFCMQMFMYASLLAAAAHYVYFAFMDHGYLAESYKNMLSQPEVKQVIRQMASKKEIDDMMSLWQAMSPLNFTIELFILNLIAGLVLSFPVALVGSRAKARQ